MEKVIYSKLGQGIIFDSMQEMEDNILPIEVIFAIGNVQPNTMTDLFGFWAHPILYKGLLKGEESKCMVFYLGTENHLFGSNIHCDVIFWISKIRIFKKYAGLSGRDYLLKNGIWK